MLAQVKSCSLFGLSVNQIKIEVFASGGLPAWEIVGLPDTAVKESKERVRAAIKNSGYEFPPRRVVVNLAPAHIKKEGPIFDLPIALAILSATEQIEEEKLKDIVAIGELGLDGSLRKVKGVLPISLSLKKEDLLILPEDNFLESSIARKNSFGFENLSQVLDFLENPSKQERKISKKARTKKQVKHKIDFSDIKGQAEAKRALTIAAAGNHNILFIGSPGSGKTMLAKTLPTIMPDLNHKESLETTKIYSISGHLSAESPLVKKHPFRAPHHTSSKTSIIGGGRIPQPGEITLSHNGILFLDELPEYNRDVLETLRQPLEEGKVTISRVNAQITYPASFLLIAAMNPCPCGYFGDSFKECKCTPYQVQKYINKISGPLLDRIDLQIEIPRVEFEELYSKEEEDNSASIQAEIIEVRDIQKKRFEETEIKTNSEMNNKEVKKHCGLDKESKDLLKTAFKNLGLSARAHFRILKVARTIADLEKKENISLENIAEAIQYRALDKDLYF